MVSANILYLIQLLISIQLEFILFLRFFKVVTRSLKMIFARMKLVMLAQTMTKIELTPLFNSYLFFAFAA
jgi:hypothetical protein